jgi:membrane protease YdiL (CAAX protease family)
MFNRYWRSYPWWMQLIQLIILIFVLFSFLVLGIGYGLLPKLMNVSLGELVEISGQTPDRVLRVVFIIQALFSAGVFLLPALLFGYFTHPRPKEYLGLRPAGKPLQWILVALLMLGALPVFLQIESWIELIDFSAATRAKQDQYEESVKAMLRMPDFISFLKVFVIMALLPAVGEELLFRGVLMRLAAQRTKDRAFPVVITSLMFALMHGNIFGMTSIFLAGVLLALIYFLTGSLWCSILAHLLNNGLQIVLFYMAGDNATVKAVAESNRLPWYLPVAGIALFSVSLYLLIRNKTALPHDWADDYTQEELSEKAV